ncbi:O-antigen ligase family protein [Filimonas effusa]|nr:O-antigen ligase family protein [Filimonas effusa]
MKAIYVVLILLSMVFVYELFLGYMQYNDIDGSSNDGSLDIKGSFQNSGVMAMYLVVQLPLMYFLILEAGSGQVKFIGNKVRGLKSLRWGIYITLFVATVFLVYKTQSRTSYLSLATISLACILLRHGHWLRRKMAAMTKGGRFAVISIMVMVVSLSACSLFAMKKASALGRMMKIAITWEHMDDFLLTGTGLGRFSWYYPQWQAEYFASHSQPPTSFFLNAGESYIIFNELLQLLKEIGLIGFALFVILMIGFFSLKSAKHFRLMRALKLTVIGILSCSLASYPLHVNYLLWLFSFCFFTAVILATSSFFSFINNRIAAVFNLKLKILSLTISVLLLSCVSVKSISLFYSYCHWMQVRGSAGSAEIRMNTYRSLEKSLGKDGKFLTDYGYVLLNEGHTAGSAIVLDDARRYFISLQTIETLSVACFENGQVNDAIACRKWLCNFLPARFGLRYELLKLYQSKNDSVNARRIANAILEMPVKIPSSRVQYIKNTAKGILEVK